MSSGHAQELIVPAEPSWDKWSTAGCYQAGSLGEPVAGKMPGTKAVLPSPSDHPVALGCLQNPNKYSVLYAKKSRLNIP